MSRKLGFWSVFALVTGSQIGTGVFMLPASLAPFGWLSLGGWAISGLGAICLALVFAQLCAHYPRTGGPHAYVQAAFGDSASFFTGWTYWVISWVSTTAVITGTIGYLTPLVGNLSSGTQLLLEIFLLLGITAINCNGVRAAGNIEFFLTALKMIPLVLMPLFALFFFNRQNLSAPIQTMATGSFLPNMSHIVLLTLWGFIGLESATTPAGSVSDPAKTIPRAVVLGTLFVAGLYFFNCLGIMGAVPSEYLAVSKAPYADTARFMWGGNWYLVISFIAAIVCLGTLNAWVLASGQIALGLAQDRLLPPAFAKTNKQGAPFFALLISSAGILPLLFLIKNQNLAQQINTIVDFSVTSFLFVYAVCCLAFIKLLWQRKSTFVLWHWLCAFFALAFCGWVIFATPGKTLLVASLFTISGIPLYWWRRVKTPVASDRFAKEMQSA